MKEVIHSDWGTWECQREMAFEEVGPVEREGEEDHAMLRAQS